MKNTRGDNMKVIDREHFISIMREKMKYESDLGVLAGLQFAIDTARELPDLTDEIAREEET